MFVFFVFFMIIYMFIFMKYLMNFYHIVNLLMILEFLMLWNLVFLSVASLNLSFVFYLLFFMVSVMEACVGLGLLIHLSRHFGEEIKLMF